MDFESAREILKQAGLGHNESKIYLTLLKIGPSMAGKIAKESSIDRSACYDSLRALVKKGFISYAIEANRKKFAASPPERIVDFLKEKQDLVEGILPTLKAWHREKEENSQVTMYKGTKGIKSVFEDILKNAKENLVIDSCGKFVEKMPYYAPHFIKGLEMSNIKVRHIVRNGMTLHSSKTTQTRFFPKDIKETIITTNIYCGKIALILWTDVPEAVIIKNKAAAQAYTDYFEMLWKSSRR